MSVLAAFRFCARSVLTRGAVALVCLLTSATTGAWAAQNAIVTKDDVRVHESPDESSREMGRFEGGTRLRVSSQNRGGWFKVEVGPSRFGWISGSDLALENVRGDLNASGIQILQPQSRQRGFSRWELALTFGTRPLTTSQKRNPFEVGARLGYYLSPVFKIRPEYRLLAARASTESDLTGSLMALSGDFLAINALPLRILMSLGGGSAKVSTSSSAGILGGIQVAYMLDPAVWLGVAGDYFYAVKSTAIKLSTPSLAAVISIEL